MDKKTEQIVDVTMAVLGLIACMLWTFAALGVAG